ncbi:hypothetical protein TIFTF001_022863 [Ficus carica]|uniref:F-box domain-containing protein n=1 Tax=Ficus carica TaxID=3494 RepID=A0AA88DC21_FICCA|nr:hypothetical protein TIFTF001_022863 [Ficus carica]
MFTYMKKLCPNLSPSCLPLRRRTKRLGSFNNKYIPEDIIRDILLRLDVKSLRRFECVCKSWQTLIRHPSFVNDHFKRQRSSSLILFQSAPKCKKENMKIYKMPRCFDGDHKIQRCKISLSSFSPEGSDKGLLCLADRRNNSVCLWNPATNESKTLPSPPTSRRWQNPTHQHGLGYDSLTDDFKVVRVCIEDGNRDPVNFFGSGNEVLVYSLGRNSWKRMDMSRVFSSSTTWKDFSYGECYISEEYCPVVCNGSIHWMLDFDGVDYDDDDEDEDEDDDVDDDDDDDEDSQVIVAFDLSTEVFKPIKLPRLGSYEEVYVIGKFSDRLSLVVENDRGSTCDIWVMKEYGVSDSWVKQVKFPLRVEIPGCPTNRYHFNPLAFGNNGKILLIECKDRLFWYDLESHKATKLSHLMGIRNKGGGGKEEERQRAKAAALELKAVALKQSQSTPRAKAAALKTGKVKAMIGGCSARLRIPRS